MNIQTDKWKDKNYTALTLKESSAVGDSSMCVPIFNLLGLTVPEISVTKHFNAENWRERKMNTGMNKQQQPDSGIHDTPAHCPCVYKVSIF